MNVGACHRNASPPDESPFIAGDENADRGKLRQILLEERQFSE
jgi:hypothetical protein